jgi:ATP-dependent DNA helicase RecG
MKSEEKDSVMNEFYKNQIQVLVSTTVVEVGMNVVNATGMIVYDADRFGLSQLHQLRGRIQRGSAKGHCWLLTGSNDEHVLERLNVLVNSNDGFEISREDLRLRGPGDILGTRQSGVPDFILGNLITDTKIIDTAKKDAEYAVRNRNNPAYTVLVNSVIDEKKKHAAVQ